MWAPGLRESLRDANRSPRKCRANRRCHSRRRRRHSQSFPADTCFCVRRRKWFSRSSRSPGPHRQSARRDPRAFSGWPLRKGGGKLSADVGTQATGLLPMKARVRNGSAIGEKRDVKRTTECYPPDLARARIRPLSFYSTALQFCKLRRSRGLSAACRGITSSSTRKREVSVTSISASHPDASHLQFIESPLCSRSSYGHSPGWFLAACQKRSTRALT